MLLNLEPYVFKSKKTQKKPEGDNEPSKIHTAVKDVPETGKPNGRSNTNHKFSNDKSGQKKKYIDAKDFVPNSNLFNKNPDIPSVPQVDSDAKEKVKEVLFSSDSIENVDIGEKLRNNLINHMKLTTLTEIQKLSIPLLLNGQDVMIKSPTGSGKTLCYSIPIIDRLSKASPPINRKDGPMVLILVPTRELALQTVGVITELCKCCISLVPGILIGGEKCKSEKARLRKGVNILVATPGRLIYHLTETSCLDISHLQFLVMDEADQLLELGNREKIDKILELVGKHNTTKRQSILLSATLNEHIKELVSVSLREPVFVDSQGTNTNSGISATKEDGTQDYVVNDSLAKAAAASTDLITPGTLTQYFITVPGKLRLVCLVVFTLTKILPPKKSKMIVFTSSKSSVAFLYNAMKVAVGEWAECMGSPVEEYNAFMLHGDMTQQERSKTFEKFKRCDSGLLLCTDVAARGLDIKKVDWVVQYDCPTQTDSYLHRVGRTARIGESGSSLLFLLPSEVEYVKLLSESSVTLTEMKVGNVLKKLAEGKGNRLVEEKAQNLQNKIELAVTESPELNDKAISAYKTYIQSYTTYPKNQKHIFHIKFLHLGHIASLNSW